MISRRLIMAVLIVLAAFGLVSGAIPSTLTEASAQVRGFEPDPGDGSSGTVTTDQDTSRSAPLTFTPNVPIPGLFEGNITVDEGTFGSYVVAFYVYFAGIAGILAVVVMMWGGFHYITSAGNPQRMSEGKEIISNAVIGLILVMTSYLLLRTINPNLLILRVPSVQYIAQQLNPERYCQAQGALATAAAFGRLCGTRVEYRDENGRPQECISLDVPADQKALPVDEQTACFPFASTTVIDGRRTATVEYRIEKAKTLCEDNRYTPDSACASTHAIFRAQKWLKGECSKADISQWTDQCRYQSQFSCPTSETAVACDVGGRTRNTTCWENGEPAVSDPNDSIRAHCVNQSPGSIAVEALCCQQDSPKSAIICSSEGPQRNEAEVPCGPYQTMAGKFKCRGILCAQPDTCSTRCFAQLRLRWSTNPLDYE